MVNFKINIVYESWDIHDDNIDVHVELEDGQRFCPSFFTLKNLETLFKKNRLTGECASGLYLWSSDMILVEDLRLETIHRTIEDLINTGELSHACQRLS